MEAPESHMKNLRIGSYQAGANLALPAWGESWSFDFEVEPRIHDIRKTWPLRPAAKGWAGDLHRCPLTILKSHPVDLLIADHSRDSCQTAVDRPWEHWIENCPVALRPDFVLQIWRPHSMITDHGPNGKSARKKLELLGYRARCFLLDNLDWGGSVDQTRYVVCGFHNHGPISEGAVEQWEMGSPPGLPPRAMFNNLRPFGAGSTFTERPVSADEQATVPEELRDPMPEAPGTWIHTTKGYRRLHSDELAKGLGVPGTWGDKQRIDASLVRHLTGVNLWEYLGGQISSLLDSGPTDQGRPKTDHEPTTPSPDSFPEVSPIRTWKWEAPDLRPQRPWYRLRLRNLQRACRTYPATSRPAMMRAGKADLTRHRGNYGDQGAVALQILWWEFPKEHWEALRLGSSMNFLKQPAPGIHPNSEMSEEALVVATEFVEELLLLGALQPCPADDPLVATAPIFCVPKPGQSGQWRIIADMKSGGQNDSIAADPVYFPRVSTILPHMYSGGWSSTVDASKFFYQFKTLVSE
jgi:hypothetical protein